MLRSAALLLTSLSAFTTLGLSSTALATVDAMFQQTIVYEGIQSGDLCYMKMPAIGEYGIGEYVVARATVTPFFVPSIGSRMGQENINLAATTPAMALSYGEYVYEQNVANLNVSLDVSALAAANGTSEEGRARTIRSAKAALLSMAQSLKGERSSGLIRLNLSFTGLPSQAGLPGTALPASTQYPYTATSPVLKAIESELIKKDCL